MRAARLISTTDEHVFGRYCRNLAKWEQLRDALDKRGYTYEAETTGGGKLRRADPAFIIADRLERQLLALEDRFGMSPAERQKIMAARAATPKGDLFDGDQERRDGDPASPPSAPAAPMDSSPVGLLN